MTRHVALSLVLFGLCTFVVAGSARAQESLVAMRASAPPVIDGRLSDECWRSAPVISSFTQREPDEGRPATERTEVRFAYDDQAIYVAAKLFDAEPGAIAARLSPRDEDADADWITVLLDPMHDRRTGALFRVSAANVQKDALLYNDTWDDSKWDAVWQSRVQVEPDGWTVELRIPLSQLRFATGERQVWGVNVERHIQRKHEKAWLAMVPKTEAGVVSRMRDLSGLDGVRPARALELVPFTTGRQERLVPEAGDPFRSTTSAGGSAGLDLKVGLTSSLTLTATVNPDFAQVEVDPAVVNLTAFETFFPEKRAFFLEGTQIFGSFGIGGSNSFWGFNTSDPTLVYSRRIGRAPQVSADGDFVDKPSATTILGAAKLTGRIGRGWNLGILDAVTAREDGRTLITDTSGLRRVDHFTAEPATNYLVARGQREFARGGFGFLTTTVTRALDTPAVRDALPSRGVVAGVDGHVFLDRRRNWVITGKAAASDVRGSEAAILRLQEGSQRYFQRPDAPQVHRDDTRTSLSGFTGRVNLNRNSGIWQVNAALWGVSPGFEANDAGFVGQADRAGGHVVLNLRQERPHRFTRNTFAWVAKWYTWNFGRQMQGDGVNGAAGFMLRNYWSVAFNGALQREVYDDRLTRGGPLARRPAFAFWRVSGDSDARQPVSLGWNSAHERNAAGFRSHTTGVTVSVKPSPRITLSLGPSWMTSHTPAQYVDTFEDGGATRTFGQHYLFGVLDQRQLSMTTRVNVILRSNLSVQLFAQPLLAAGVYTNYRELAAPGTFTFRDYGLDTPFTFDDPNFNRRSLRANTVVRWEPRPGTTLYGVWSREQVDDTDVRPFAFSRDAGRLAHAPGHDVFLVKFAWWMTR